MNDFDEPDRKPKGLSRLSIDNFTPLGRWEAIQSIRRAESGPPKEVLIRCCFILIGATAVSFAVGHVAYVIWAIAYVTVSLSYLGLLRRSSPPVSKSRFALLLGMHALGGMVFASAPISVWLFELSRLEHALALVVVAGHIMFNLTHRKFPTWAILIDQAWILITLAVIATQGMQNFESGTEKLLIGLATAMLAIYYVQAHFGSVFEHVYFLQSRMDALREQSDNAAAQITAGVAHDFNNILTVVQGNIDLAELTDNPSERREFLEQARASTLRASEIVAQMMSYVGKSQLEAKPHRLSDLLDELGPDLTMVVPDTVVLDVRRPGPAQVVIADRVKLKTALVHLVRNAGEAIGPQDVGTISVSVETLATETLTSLGLASQKQTFIAIRVTDTGPGIQEDTLARVTEPFFSTKPKGQGSSGLGLSMVKGFAKQSGGTLVLQNAEPQGLEATLVLPAPPGDGGKPLD